MILVPSFLYFLQVWLCLPAKCHPKKREERCDVAVCAFPSSLRQSNVAMGLMMRKIIYKWWIFQLRRGYQKWQLTLPASQSLPWRRSARRSTRVTNCAPRSSGKVADDRAPESPIIFGHGKWTFPHDDHKIGSIWVPSHLICNSFTQGAKAVFKTLDRAPARLGIKPLDESGSKSAWLGNIGRIGSQWQ